MENMPDEPEVEIQMETDTTSVDPLIDQSSRLYCSEVINVDDHDSADSERSEFENPTDHRDIFEKYEDVEKNKIQMQKEDIRQKHEILKHVALKCKQIATTQNIPNSTLNRLHFFTNQPKNYLQKLLKNNELQKRTFKDALLGTAPIPSYILPVLCNDVRNIFIEFYVEKRQMPTETEFLKSLKGKNENEFYKNVKFRTLVKNKLVIYNHVQELNKVILTENPEFMYLRNKYLRQVINFRESGRNFTYVTIMLVPVEIGVGPFAIAIAASLTAGFIDDFKCLGHPDDDGHKEMKNWIMGNLLPKLDKTSIIVLTQLKKKDTTPTPYSTKQEMTAWLVKRNIPFGSDNHKGKLYTLVKQFRKEKYNGFYEEVFTAAGFKVLVNPDEYENLDFFRDIQRECTTDEVTEHIIEFLKSMPKEDWAKMEERITEAEKQMIKEDRKMEIMVENIFEMVKNGDVNAADFPDGCDSDKFSNFDVHIGDIIVD